MSAEHTDTVGAGSEVLSAELLERLMAALADLRFGAVEITVHDGRIVQIERREKYRFEGRPR